MYIDQKFSVIDLIIGLVGVAGYFCVFLSILKSSPRPIQIRDWKNLFFLILIIILFGSFTVLVNYLAYTADIKFDVTRFKQHTLTDKTKDFIGSLKNDVQITVFYVGLPPKYIEDLLREYESAGNGKISTEVIDPIIDIGYAAQFGNIISGQEKKVIIQSGKERRDIDFTEEYLSEDMINNAIIRVSREAKTTYFITGHGEYNIFSEETTGLKKFVTLMHTNNINSKRLLLDISDGVPEDCDLLVIAGPNKHYSEKEVGLIKEYLEQGGDALILVEHTVVTEPDKPLSKAQLKLNPSMNEILNDWGLNVSYDIVVDLASHASGDVGSPATKNYPPHKAIVSDLDYTFYIRPRSIAQSDNRRKTIKLAPLILTQTPQSSWAETDRMLNVKFDEGLDTAGPVPIAYIAWEPKAEGDLSDTRMIVVTDADFVSNAYIDFYSNANMGLNIVNWLLESDYKVFVDDKELDIYKMELTSRQKRTVLLILFLIPFSILLAGFIRWFFK